MTPRRLRAAILGLAAGLLGVGCDTAEVDTTYGRSRGPSINGTGAFAGLLREGGHEVRAAVRATDTLAEWADVLVRFSPHPGPVDLEEGRWFRDWLRGGVGRKLVYVVRDSDAEFEFWEAMLAAEPPDAPAEVLDPIRKRRDLARSWQGDLPPRPKEAAPAADWITFEAKPGAPSACKSLGGPWAEGVDATAAAVARHEVFVDDGGGPVLLTGDGAPLAMTWTFGDDGEVLAIANASFLLNASLLNRARRPLTIRVVDWIGPGPHHIALLEGAHPTAEAGGAAMSSAFQLMRVRPFDWISAHLLGFLLLLALSYAVRLGRPIPEPPSGVERPSAHPEALGALLARTGRPDAARALLETYRRWRHPSPSPSPTAGRSAPTPPPPLPPRVPRR